MRGSSERTVRVHNGRDGANARTLFVQVKTKGGGKPKKPKPKEPEGLYICGQPRYSGSHGQCVRIAFNRPLCHQQCGYVEEALQRSECYTYVKEVRWADNRKTLVVEVLRDSIQECSRLDIDDAVRNMVHLIPNFTKKNQSDI